MKVKLSNEKDLIKFIELLQYVDSMKKANKMPLIRINHCHICNSDSCKEQNCKICKPIDYHTNYVEDDIVNCAAINLFCLPNQFQCVKDLRELIKYFQEDYDKFQFDIEPLGDGSMLLVWDIRFCIHTKELFKHPLIEKNLSQRPNRLKM